jgi:hypothetical protein
VWNEGVSTKAKSTTSPAVRTSETIKIGQEYLRNVADWPRNLSSIFGALTYHGGPIQYKSEKGAKVMEFPINRP